MRFSILIVLLAICFQTFAIEAFVDIKKFEIPNQSPFVELHFLIPGSSVERNDLSRSKVEVTVVFTQEEKIVKVDKYNLNGSENSKANLIDLKRYNLDYGKYLLEINLKDTNAESAEKNISAPIEILKYEAAPHFSDILLTEKFEKSNEEGIYNRNGYDLIPNVLNFYSKTLNEMGFYVELYNTSKYLVEKEFLISYSVVNAQTKKVVNNLRLFQKAEINTINVFQNKFDISALPSGNFLFQIEARDKKNELITTKSIAFQRSNPSIGNTYALKSLINDENEKSIEGTFVNNLQAEEIEFAIGSLVPIVDDASSQKILNLLESKNIKLMKNALYNFWLEKNMLNPQAEFEAYNKIAKNVDDLYGSEYVKGHFTDRGHFYLKYGAPNDKLVSPSEPGAYDYEIWQYFTVEKTGQSNCMVVFYDPTNTGSFEMLHSEIRGELRNDNWQQEIYRRFEVQNNRKNFDNSNTRNSFGNKSTDFFNGFNNGGNSNNNLDLEDR